MTETFLITGSASGMGRATAERLRASGAKVIGADLHDADIIADLSTAEGRAELIARAAVLAPDGLDGVVAGAGIVNPAEPRKTVAVNYFGAIATLAGLRPLLAKRSRGRAVAICSTTALLPGDDEVIAACLAEREGEALDAIHARPESAYISSKAALSLWLRKTAISKEWAGANILLNGIAPGVVKTEMTLPLFGDPEVMGLITRSNPMAVDGYAEPEEMAELIEFLLRFKGHYLVGQIIFNDGGTDAIMRPHTF